MTDPDWEPVMKRAAAIVTNRGGRTCHAAIIARELGMPAVVGCGESATDVRDGARGHGVMRGRRTGYVYEVRSRSTSGRSSSTRCRRRRCKIMMNVGNPERAFGFAALPHHGVGLARLEFIINRMIGVHPKSDARFRPAGRRSCAGRSASKWRVTRIPTTFYVAKLAEGIAQIAAAFAPEPVIVRLSDFKSNEYANLLGGRATSRTRRTRCSVSAAPRATSIRVSGLASSSSAARCGTCARRWGSPT